MAGSFISLRLAVVLILSTTLLIGCSANQKINPNAVYEKSSEKDPVEVDAEKKQRQTKPLLHGQTHEGEMVKNLTVSQITETENLESAEATKLLQKDGQGESPEGYKMPEYGFEYLMLTLSFLAKKDGGVTGFDLKLVDGEGEEFEQVYTNGYGGVFNAPPTAKGKSSKLTAVFEVPKNKYDLYLIYVPYGEEANPAKFKIR